MAATSSSGKSTGKPDPLAGLEDDKYGPLDGEQHENPGKTGVAPGSDGKYGGRKAYAEQALPADVDPAVPAEPEHPSVAAGRAVTDAREVPENFKFVKEQFFNGPASSKRPTLTELHNERDGGYQVTDRPEPTKDATSHDIVVEILHRAGIQHDHPELIVPFAQALDGIDYSNIPNNKPVR
jgi:hypothetical protein